MVTDANSAQEPAHPKVRGARNWSLVQYGARQGKAYAVLELLSPDGDQGFPGPLRLAAGSTCCGAGAET